MGGLNNNAIGLKSNHTMVLYVDFVCGVWSRTQVDDERDASRSERATLCCNIKITSVFTAGLSCVWSQVFNLGMATAPEP